MNKIIFLCSLMAVCAFSATWKKEANANLNLSQNSNHNWVAGGQDALVWQADLKGNCEGTFALWTWNNQAEIAYGKTKVANQDSRKHLDKIFLESVLQFSKNPAWMPYASGRLESQFTKSFAYSDTASPVAVSDFWDPGYLTESAGMSWIPNSILQTRAGFALKQTYSDKYGWADHPETSNRVESFRLEPGLESITEVNYAWNDILKYQGRLSAFVNFKGLNAIDGHLENTLNAQVAKYLVFSAGLEMLYDKDLSLNSQLRQNVTIGLTYQLL